MACFFTNEIKPKKNVSLIVLRENNHFHARMIIFFKEQGKNEMEKGRISFNNNS